MELGATEILALQALPEIPSVAAEALRAGVSGGIWSSTRPCRRAFDPDHPAEPPLGSLRDALHWKRENIERWLALGCRDAGG